jgi:NAD(P)-dependent dehydrogenase (short-subunit alcohol dehydrogenase family)
MAIKNGKVALITGANKGLGKEIGRQLGALGYTVVLTARDAQAGETVVAELVAAGHDAHIVRLEVTSADDIND